MFGLGKSNEKILQDEEARKAEVEAAAAKEDSSTKVVEDAVKPETYAPVPEAASAADPAVDPAAETPTVEPEAAPVADPAASVDPVEQVATADAATAAPVADPAASVDPVEQVATADAATAEVTKVDPATGEEHVEKVELTGDFPPFPSDHKTSPSFDGHKYVVTAFADFGDGEKQVVVGYTHHSNGGGLLEYVDTHPLYSKPLLRELSFEEQIALAKAAV